MHQIHIIQEYTLWLKLLVHIRKDRSCDNSDFIIAHFKFLKEWQHVYIDMQLHLLICTYWKEAPKPTIIAPSKIWLKDNLKETQTIFWYSTFINTLPNLIFFVPFLESLTAPFAHDYLISWDDDVTCIKCCLLTNTKITMKCFML